MRMMLASSSSNSATATKHSRRGSSLDGEILEVFDSQMFFISHRWLQPSLNPDEAHPDDESNSKLKAIINMVGPFQFFWIDFMCAPQRDPEAQFRAIQSLPFYVHCSARFSSLLVGDEGKEVYLDRLWCQAEIIASKLPLRLPHFQVSWLAAPLRGKFIFIEPDPEDAIKSQDPASPQMKVPATAVLASARLRNAKRKHSKNAINFAHIRDPSTCSITVPSDMEKILPLLKFSIGEYEALLDWDKTSTWNRRKTKTFGQGKYRIDDDPDCGTAVTTEKIRNLIKSLVRGVESIERRLALMQDLKRGPATIGYAAQPPDLHGVRRQQRLPVQESEATVAANETAEKNGELNFLVSGKTSKRFQTTTTSDLAVQKSAVEPTGGPRQRHVLIRNECGRTAKRPGS